MGDLDESDRSEAISQVQRMVALRQEGYMRFWPIHAVEVNPAPVSLKQGARQLARVVLEIEGLGYGAPRPEDLERARMGAPWGFAVILPRFVENSEGIARCLDPRPPAYSHSTLTEWSPADLPAEGKAFRFGLNRDEALRILPQRLEEAGIDPRATDPGQIHLLSRGKAVPLLRLDDADGAFEEGEALVFYGRQSESPYSTERAYWVVIGAQGPAAQMPVEKPPGGSKALKTRPWRLARQRIEEDRFREHHLGDFLSIREIRWLWATLSADTETTFTFALSNLAERDSNWPEMTPLSFEFFHSPPNQLPANAIPIEQRKIWIEVNGQVLEEKTFANYQDEKKDYFFPTGLLQEEGNFVRMRLESAVPGAASERLSEGSFFDAMTIDYPRRPVAENGRLIFDLAKEDNLTTSAFTLSGFSGKEPLVLLDVTEPDSPAVAQPIRREDGGVRIALPAGASRRLVASELDRMTSAPLFVPATRPDLRREDRSADYLIISHPDFIDLVKPLADLKRAQGLQVEVVNVLDIYEEFSNGELNPLAIKEFLLYAMERWRVPPTYVLLVGDANSDYRNEARTDVRNFIPTFRLALEGDEDEVRASEHWYTTILGNDEYPDLILSRISVNSRQDAERVIAKAMAASQGLPMGPWRNRLVWISDDEPEFPNACESLRLQRTPPEFFTDRIYLNKLRWERNFYIDRAFVDAEDLKVSTEATQAILDAFNRGATLVGFWGHGSPNIWSDERIWFGGDSPNSDNLLLRNGALLPFVVNFTCDTGSIDYPVPSWNVCIAEDMMRAAEGGARGLFVPSGPGVTADHSLLAEHLMRAFFDDRVVFQGDAVTLAVSRFLGDSRTAGANETRRLDKYAQMYVLLGDPTTPFPIPRQTCRLGVEPACVEAGQTSLRVSILQAPFDSGQAVFRLEDPLGDSAGEEAGEDRFSPEKRTFTLRLPSRPRLGQWKVKAYLWNEELGLEASGAADFPLDLRYAEIKEFQVSGSAEGRERPRLRLVLANRSLLPIEDLRFEIRRKEGPLRKQIATGSIALGPGEEKPWEMAWEPASGLHELSAQLLNYNRSPRPELTLTTRQEIVWANPDPNGPLQFALSPYALKKTFRRVDEVAEMEVQTPVIVAGGQYEGEVEVGWGYGTEIETTTTVRFPGKGAFSSNSAVFTVQAAPPELPKPFFVVVDPKRKLAEADNASGKMLSSLDLSALPDLAFYTVGGGGVVVDPVQPSDGQTVFFRVSVENRGAAPAGRFRVAAYDGDPDKGAKELPNRPGPAYCEIEGLAPGARTEAFLRWDPKESAGDHRIYFKLDPLNRVLESNKANNLSVLPLHVRSLARLEDTRIEFDFRELGRLRLLIKVSTHNSGESAARNVVFAFYGAREPVPEAKLGEILARGIEPGQTHAETYVWNLPASFRQDVLREGFSISASAQIYLKGSLQRITVFRHSYMPKE